MRKILTFLFAALMSVGMWAVTPQGADTWDEGTKTLTVNSNPGSYSYFKSDIENLVISDAVTSIGDHAFEECTALTSVTFGNSVTSIGGYAFYLCPGLTSVTIGNSVESIGGAAFCSCTGLTSITIPNSVTSIGARVFWGCGSLTSVTIPNSVTSIGADAFYSCTSITDIYCYPNAANLTWNEDCCDDFKANKETRCHVDADQLSAYQEKFTGEVNVTFVGPPVAPSWVRAGDEWADASKTLTVNSDPTWRAYMGQTEIEHVIISSGVTSIGVSAFEKCSGLTSVTISNSVTSIDADAFYDCPNITDVYCYPNAANLTWNEDAEDDFKENKETVCHVHADQLSAYQEKFTGEVNVTFVGDLPGGSPATVAVTGVTLNQNEAQMTVGGETLTLTATVNPEGATDKSVSWSTSDGNVATVDNGVVTAVAAGTATITVTTTDGSYTATCDVTVTAPAPTGFDITANLDPQNAGVYYSTFYHGSVDYALPANVKAYKAVISGSNLLLSEVAAEGDVLPKGNAVILRSSVQNYTLTPSDATPVSVGDDNDLEGTDDAIATPAKCYVLSCENNLVGFYQYGADNLNPHKAYVIFSGSGSNPAPRRMPFIFDATTDVENVQGNVQSTKVLRDGQLIIIRNGVEYNANGMMVK